VPEESKEVLLVMLRNMREECRRDNMAIPENQQMFMRHLIRITEELSRLAKDMSELRTSLQQDQED